MKLYADITQLQATDIAELLPMLKIQSDTAVGKLAQVINRVPKNRLCDFLNLFSSEDLLDILSTAATQYQEQILAALEKSA